MLHSAPAALLFPMSEPDFDNLTRPETAPLVVISSTLSALNESLKSTMAASHFPSSDPFFSIAINGDTPPFPIVTLFLLFSEMFRSAHAAFTCPCEEPFFIILISNGMPPAFATSTFILSSIHKLARVAAACVLSKSVPDSNSMISGRMPLDFTTTSWLLVFNARFARAPEALVFAKSTCSKSIKSGIPAEFAIKTQFLSFSESSKSAPVAFPFPSSLPTRSISTKAGIPFAFAIRTLFPSLPTHRFHIASAAAHLPSSGPVSANSTTGGMAPASAIMSLFSMLRARLDSVPAALVLASSSPVNNTFTNAGNPAWLGTVTFIESFEVSAQRARAACDFPSSDPVFKISINGGIHPSTASAANSSSVHILANAPAALSLHSQDPFRIAFINASTPPAFFTAVRLSRIPFVKICSARAALICPSKDLADIKLTSSVTHSALPGPTHLSLACKSIPSVPADFAFSSIDPDRRISSRVGNWSTIDS
mmetsp:Transcript_39211/g.54438  ORF Transcript_39211/g.54438 Transcript_39211/m.54438 type:complete len:482 (+) Transcript_39211:856-2301(+)